MSKEADMGRRNILLAGGMVAAAGMMASAAEAEAEKIDLGNAIKVGKTPAAKVAAPRDKAVAAAKTKQELVGSGFKFLSRFQGDQIVDALIYDELKGLENKIPPYDPFQLENLAASATQFLDRCLIIRRDMYDLEEEAVKRALEYSLFLEQLSPQQKIELAEYVEAQRAQEKVGQDRAAREFAESDNHLNGGFALISKAVAASSQIAVDGEKERKQSVHDKWQALVNYQQALQARHDAPGSSLNYAERFDRLVPLIRQDARIAYQKLRCLETGMERVFGIKQELDAPRATGYLDTMIRYLRTILERANIVTQNEIEFEHVVSLHHGQSTLANGTPKAALIADALWNVQMGAAGEGKLSFSLKDEFPAQFDKLRLKGVGLSVVFSDPKMDLRDNTLHLRSASALVFPPPAPDLFSPGSTKAKPPVVVGVASWLDPLQMRIVASPHVQNLDPRGIWNLQMSPNILNNAAGSLSRNATIVDVRLHLRCGALMAASANEFWPSFTW